MSVGKTKLIKRSYHPNYKNTRLGTVTGGFDRVNLFQQAEQGFDKLFGYKRQQMKSFDSHNIIKNGSISERLRLQEQEFRSSERKIEINQDSNQENLLSINLTNMEASKQIFNVDIHISTKQESDTFANPFFSQGNNSTTSSYISDSQLEIVLPSNHEEEILSPKRKYRL